MAADGDTERMIMPLTAEASQVACLDLSTAQVTRMSEGSTRALLVVHSFVASSQGPTTILVSPPNQGAQSVFSMFPNASYGAEGEDATRNFLIRQGGPDALIISPLCFEVALDAPSDAALTFSLETADLPAPE